MTILYHPEPGTILVCDYFGLKEPEMIKKRPVIVVSPRSRRNKLVTVVPISTTPPHAILAWHYNIMLTEKLSPNWPSLSLWVKCDMINTFSLGRYDRFHSKIAGGHRKYYDRRISDEDLARIRGCLASFLCLKAGVY